MSSIRSEQRGDALWLTIDNPEKRNALALADLTALSEALAAAAEAPGLRAVVLTGAGDRVFSGGVDLSDVTDARVWGDNPLSALCDRLEAFPRPTIARINGKVRGGATELTLACDFRIGAIGADVMVPAARIGIHYEPSGLRRAIARIGMQATRRMYLLAETFDAVALSELSYFDRLVGPSDLDATVEAMLEAIRAGAPLAVDGMKATLAEIGAGAFDPDAARARIERSWASDDMKEGLEAARARRKPNFTGR